MSLKLTRIVTTVEARKSLKWISKFLVNEEGGPQSWQLEMLCSVCTYVCL